MNICQSDKNVLGVSEGEIYLDDDSFANKHWQKVIIFSDPAT